MSTRLYRAPRFPLVHADLNCAVLQSWATGCSREPAPHRGIPRAEEPEEILVSDPQPATLRAAGWTPCVCVPVRVPAPAPTRPPALTCAITALTAKFSLPAAAGLLAGQTLRPRSHPEDEPDGFRTEPGELTEALAALTTPHREAAIEATLLAELLGTGGMAAGFPVSPFRHALTAQLRAGAQRRGLPHHASTPLLRLGSRLGAHAQLPASLAELTPLPEGFLEAAESQLLLHAAAEGLDIDHLHEELELLHHTLGLARPVALALPDEVFVLRSWREGLRHAPEIAAPIVLAERCHLGEDLALRLPGVLAHPVQALFRNTRCGSAFLPLGELRADADWRAAAPVALALYRDAQVPAYADASRHHLVSAESWDAACDALASTPGEAAHVPAASTLAP